jgi:hypothetical protein
MAGTGGWVDLVYCSGLGDSRNGSKVADANPPAELVR